MKTFVPKKTDIVRSWYLIDAAGKPVGRIAAEAAKILRGKNKATFTPHLDTGDGIVIVNAKDIVLTGNKWGQKKYFRYSRYVGNLKEFTAEKMHEKDPTFILETAIAGMIPRTKFKKDIMMRLKVYATADHQQDAQKPQALEI